MKQLSLRSGIMLIIAMMFVLGLLLFCVIYFTNASNWVMHPANSHLYTNGEFTEGGSVYDCNGTVLAKTQNNKRVFNADRSIRLSTLHAVGDANGFISTGVQTAFREELAGYNLITGLFPKKKSYNNITLTIDAEVSAAALSALGSYSGTIGMYNYKTGELLCMVSTPTYDVESESDTEKAINGEYEGVFMNRFLSSTYAPGSTFKIVTAAAAIDTLPDAYTRKYTCKGGCTIGGETVKCTGYHGDISLEQAFAVSCNSYFSSLAVDLGKDTMTRYARKFGFGKSYSIDGIEAAKSSYDVENARKIELGWSGIGQYNDMANPLQYLTSVGAIANGGTPIKPYFIKQIENSSGITVSKGKATKGNTVVSESTAEKLTELMRGATEITYGKSFFGSLNVCGKTGTAEVDGRTPHAEFVGFCTDEDYPFAFVVVVEEGGSGNSIAKSAANTVLQAAKLSYDSKKK